LYIRILSMLGLARVHRVLPKPKFIEAKPVADMETLQAVIVHRYDVMAQFARSLRRACKEEAARLRALRKPEFHLLEGARRWLVLDADKWTEQNRAKLGEILAASDRVKLLVEMRRELSAVWERSNMSREQLVQVLQDWCHRAEKSGVAALEDLSLRMRRYAASWAGPACRHARAGRPRSLILDCSWIRPCRWLEWGFGPADGRTP